jgi:predicted kinase
MKSLHLDKPHAIVVIGIQGSGKTFFAEKFATTFKAPYIEQALFNGAARDTKAADHLFESVLTETLKTGKSVVVELVNSSRSDRLEIARHLSKAGYELMLIWVQVDQETAMIRAKRATGITSDEYREEVKRFSAPLQSEKPLVISGKHTFASQAKVVLKRLSPPRPTPKPIDRPQQPHRGQIIVR